MPYRFAIDRPDYSDLASGRVLYSLPGHPAFPVRLASEIFQRCFTLWNNGAASQLPAIYDPCCGAGYLLTVLAYLHEPSIRAVAASDVDPIAVQLAERNLSLLTIAGVDRRIEELSADLFRYQKDSHRQALESARRIRENISSRTREILTRVFSSDAGDAPVMLRGLNGLRADIVITDIPYGRHSDWRGILRGEPHPSQAMLDALLAVISPAGVVAVAADKSQKIQNESFKRIDLFQIGKRRVTILRPKD